MTIFVEKSANPGTFNDLDFPVKVVRFSYKNWQIFFKKIVKSQEKFSTFSGKFYDFLKKICLVIGKFNGFCRKM